MQTRGSAWGIAAVCSIAVACNAPLPTRATKLWRRRASEATLLSAVSGLPTSKARTPRECCATRDTPSPSLAQTAHLRSLREAWSTSVPADAHLDAPARGRVLHPRLGHPGHRAQEVYDLLGALQRAHHARAHGLCFESQWLTNGQPLRLVCVAPLRVSCAAGQRAWTPRCAGRG